MKKVAFGLAIVMGLTANGFNPDSQAGVKNHYTRSYRAAIDRCGGKKKVGPNIRRRGVRMDQPQKFSQNHRVLRWREPSHKEYKRQTQRLNGLCPYVPPVRHTVQTSVQRTAAPATVSSGNESLVQCIISSESGGNPTVVNSSGHAGVGQWALGTWVADGGTRYAPTPTGATYDQQVSIIREQVAAGHAGQWTNYDPC